MPNDGKPIMIKAQLEIIQHSLGVDQYGRGQMYRNHFRAGAADDDNCKQLEALGYMFQHPYNLYSVTELGKAAMLRESPNPNKLTRSRNNLRAKPCR